MSRRGGRGGGLSLFLKCTRRTGRLRPLPLGPGRGPSPPPPSRPTESRARAGRSFVAEPVSEARARRRFACEPGGASFPRREHDGGSLRRARRNPAREPGRLSFARSAPRSLCCTRALYAGLARPPSCSARQPRARQPGSRRGRFSSRRKRDPRNGPRGGPAQRLAGSAAAPRRRPAFPWTKRQASPRRSGDCPCAAGASLLA